MKEERNKQISKKIKKKRKRMSPLRGLSLRLITQRLIITHLFFLHFEKKLHFFTIPCVFTEQGTRTCISLH